MKCNMELHLRHLVYFLLGGLWGITAKYFFASVLNLPDAGIEAMLFFWLFLTVIGFAVDAMVEAPRRLIDKQRFWQCECIVMMLLSVPIAALLFYSVVYGK